MKATPVMAAAMWLIGFASIATFFYVSVTRGFLTGTVEFGTLIVGVILIIILIARGVIDRRVLDRALLRPSRDDFLSGAVFTAFLAVTAGAAVQFPGFPWPLGALAALLVTAGFRAALTVRHEQIRH